jgi:hypothetical protein
MANEVEFGPNNDGFNTNSSKDGGVSSLDPIHPNSFLNLASKLFHTMKIYPKQN